ncbi:uncharacterized protein F4812DRAFT_187931 [Daldinia caldariorum]|uniref:uncharacterized protein n=1 Tax=Daldinia caldariorum TaxID=326644 RepID=UPI002008CD03|nr:uncharacterized protein F4812DRAFT_187931 [Daldinia caldariorum]KAI1471657.1 hypothetical protein F4812DRAFT_187931 [Daldinia caldariorum]
MLSHLRFHRRGPSNPSSPVPETGPWDAAALQPTQLVPDDGVPAPDIRPRSATSVPFTHGHGQPPSQPALPQSQHPLQNRQPPTLPPITGISSAELDLTIDLEKFEHKPREELKHLSRSSYNGDSGFIGGLALQNYRREQEALKPGSLDRNANRASDSPSFGTYAGTANFPSRPAPPTKPVKAASSFVPPGSLQNANTTSKRLQGTRMVSDSQASHGQDAPRAKKSLPFLKNPMSTLLLRRKTSQNVPDLTLPLRGQDEEPLYDPRIRGTRVHDFSAPRPRKVIPNSELVNSGVERPRQDVVSPPTEHNSPVIGVPPVPPKDGNSQSTRSSSTNSRTVSVDATSLQKSQDSVDSRSNVGSKNGRYSQRRTNSIPPSLKSLKSLSRNVSEASSRDVLSSVPKHMKSTSSRFSFDMIGAAKQEKLLEERHRQRQQDKRTDEPPHQRDSRFDDFDEDAFDYDAMDYDDGLEERIPGVNADLDEEDVDGVDDPDNDQENFAGFTFQRSNPVSVLASPHGTGISRTSGDAINSISGYVMTQELPGVPRPLSVSMESPGEAPVKEASEQNTPTGLGIQGLETVKEMSEQLPFPQQQQGETTRQLSKDDELYFNDGLIHDFDGEGDGSAFDESIFDLEDTDRYGRPIPGLFANALSQRKAAEEAKKRESDMTSSLSAPSDYSQSTAHTSLSTDLQSKPTESEPILETQQLAEERKSSVFSLDATEQDQVAAYQAALAAAAHQAAASGKFRRDSSPPPPTELTITSPTTPASTHAENLDDYEYDDGLSTGLDDYELDDDDIIAEANASALANDSDGWYGQEFGFYSAPAPLHSHHNSNALSEKNLYQYSHGGYFGPSGINRSTSGRIVSREPNLTPITERSEYSNRNSLMSLGMSQSANANGPLQSPGLAQLAMMADDDDMSLSALLRLRSKAWGGSQVSLVSSREGSPNDRNGAASPWGQDHGIAGSHGRKNSAFSIFSQDSAGAGSGSGSPTLTMSMPGIPNSSIPPITASSNSNLTLTTCSSSLPIFSPLQPSSVCPPVFEDEESSPFDERKTDIVSPSLSTSSTMTRPLSENMSPTIGIPSQQRPGMGHKHRGSADSISYTKEEDSGETRWIMERRRTAESGEIEVLGRQVVDRGRI